MRAVAPHRPSSTTTSLSSSPLWISSGTFDPNTAPHERRHKATAGLTSPRIHIQNPTRRHLLSKTRNTIVSKTRSATLQEDNTEVLASTAKRKNREETKHPGLAPERASSSIS